MSLTRSAFKRLYYPIDVIAQCVRWYLAYALGLRDLEEMMVKCGINVDHSTLHRWVIRLVPLLDKVFRRHKQRLQEARLLSSTGSTGDSYNNAMAESIDGLYKAVVIYRKSWKNRSEVELTWVAW